MITITILGIEKETTFNILTNFLIRERYDQRKKYVSLLNQNNLRRMINEITNFLKMIMIRIIFSMIKKANNFFIYLFFFNFKIFNSYMHSQT